ncbi:MAG TPA: phosphatase PAP2 family protein [Actinomycetes bacterium]|nr:phosphatase PAP2 family protein [Actinomycetes bacterium]
MLDREQLALVEWLLARLVKALAERPRPPLAAMAAHADGLAFPSGHATQAMAVFGMLTVLVALGRWPWRGKVAFGAGALLIVLVVGFSRLYLGVHWLTDVLAGWALGACWLLALSVGTWIRQETLPEPDRSGGRRLPRRVSRA